MPGILDILASRGILQSIFGQQEPPAGQLPLSIRRQLAPTATQLTSTAPAQMLRDAAQAQNPVASQSPETTPLALAMQGSGGGGGGSYDMPDVALALQQANMDPNAVPSGPDQYSSTYNKTAGDFQAAQKAAEDNKEKYGWADALIDAGRGLMIAGSPDPAKASAMFAESWAAERAGRKPKITPIQGGAFSMVTYPNGKTDFIRNDEVAKFVSDQTDMKRLFELLKIEKKADAEVTAAGRKEAGKELVKGAGDSTQTNLAVSELNNIADSLLKTDSATGPALGLLPKAARDIVTPEGASFQDRAERIIQASLRATLGAQFTEKEGTRFLERAYNPRIPEAENAKRLRQIAKELSDIQADKEAALTYMKDKGTLEGFVPKGSQPAAQTAPSPAQGNTGGGPAKISSESEWSQLPSGTQYIGPDGKLRTKR